MRTLSVNIRFRIQLFSLVAGFRCRVYSLAVSLILS